MNANSCSDASHVFSVGILCKSEIFRNEPATVPKSDDEDDESENDDDDEVTSGILCICKVNIPRSHKENYFLRENLISWPNIAAF